jgi:hypothetical protein
MLKVCSKSKESMNSIKVLLMVAAGLAGASNAVGADSAALEKLQGKWSGKGTGGDGREVTLEIKGGKLTFQILNADKEVRLYATGNVKAEMQGPFRVLKITDIDGGRSATETQPVNDDRSTVYWLSGDTLTLASNFDKERDNQGPRVEVYQRVESPKAAAPVPADAGKLAGKWKVTMKLGEDERDYEMNLAQTDGKLSGVMISPRTGEYKFKSATFTGGKLTLEWPREINGNEVVFLYTGQLKDEQLAGEVVVKGYEDQFKGTWTARK